VKKVGSIEIIKSGFQTIFFINIGILDNAKLNSWNKRVKLFGWDGT